MRWQVKLSLTVTIVFVALVLTSFWFTWHLWVQDYSTIPASQVYTMVLGSSPPKSVRNLRVYGHGLASKQQVWMSFDISGPAIDELTRGRPSLTQSEFNQYTPPVPSGCLVCNMMRDDSVRANWPDAVSAKGSAYYKVGPHKADDDSYWIGVLVADRRRNRTYIAAQLD
jgi:hypothetical protein